MMGEQKPHTLWQRKINSQDKTPFYEMLVVEEDSGPLTHQQNGSELSIAHEEQHICLQSFGIWWRSYDHIHVLGLEMLRPVFGTPSFFPGGQQSARQDDCRNKDPIHPVAFCHKSRNLCETGTCIIFTQMQASRLLSSRLSLIDQFRTYFHVLSKKNSCWDWPG